MKKLGLVFLVAIALASPAMAGQIQVGYPGGSYGPYEANPGGEFTLNVYTSGLSTGSYAAASKNVGVVGTFQTFCLEGSEVIYPWDAKYFADLDHNAMFGGNYPAGDPVSVGTGWLYSQFAQGTLAGYHYLGTPADRQASAALLQNAIWWLEGEEGVGYTGANPYMAAVVAEFGTACGGNLACAQAAAKANGGWNYGVYALNLWTSDTVHNTTTAVQDQLFYAVPDGGTTLMLLGGALMGLGALRRKFRV
jgi:hypothetical protein